MTGRLVWIDLANSPHPLLFAPVVRELEAQGDRVVLTVRDHAQTLELARDRWPDAEVIGRESPAGRLGKARALGSRIAALRGWARRKRPDVALSHNSYAQIAAARLSGIPAVTAMDFEHQPSNHVAFRLANKILLPEAVPAEVVSRQGASPKKVARYPGLKESLYIGDFEPDPAEVDRVVGHLGSAGPLVVVRTPPSRAIYHRFENVLFSDVLKSVCSQRDVRCVVLPRHAEQAEAIDAMGLERCVVPDVAVDARSLMYAADLVIGAGGTMSREAALMGVPTLSMFAGEQPAVDRWLVDQGTMELLSEIEQIQSVQRRKHGPRPLGELRTASEGVLRAFVEATRGVSWRRDEAGPQAESGGAT